MRKAIIVIAAITLIVWLVPMKAQGQECEEFDCYKADAVRTLVVKARRMLSEQEGQEFTPGAAQEATATSVPGEVTATVTSVPTEVAPAATSVPTEVPATATSMPTEAAPAATSVPTEVPATATSMPTEAAPAATSVPTEAPSTATSMPTEAPSTATSVPTEAPSTATSVPTEVPPTATSVPTEAPPTATSMPTEVPPTATSVPPTATSVPTQVPPTATQGPSLPPPSFNECAADPNASLAPNYPVRIVSIDKSAEVVRLENVSDESVNLTGWRMCSIRGNQEHVGLSGTLAPGEVKDFSHQGGNIWSNSQTDDGALYNANGQLVSYWYD